MKNFHVKYFLKCGYLNNFIMSLICNYTKNINTFELDFICLYYIIKIKCNSSTINFYNYKFSSCISFENIICHGIPIEKKIDYKFLKIDISIKYNNLHSDSCYNSNFLLKKKNFFFKNFFYNIINILKINLFYSFFNKIIFYVKKNFFINEDYCSHGIFLKLHNNLIIQHNKNNTSKKIKNFDSFTIEPMFIIKNKNGLIFYNIFLSKNNNLTFQWEHTLYIMNKKIILTTLRKNELCYITQ
ncbi:M24 family metallopeptidase [Candidatus Carsonella ruddii]|uniref:M24 family metallopeptidase n=1 Tax=Carsonella ruddii TaxID=114186 RepID=UPI003D9A510D